MAQLATGRPTGQIDFIGRGTRPSDFSNRFSEGNVSNISNFKHVENFHLENQLDKSDDRVPLPINLFDRLAFQWPEIGTRCCTF